MLRWFDSCKIEVLRENLDSEQMTGNEIRVLDRKPRKSNENKSSLIRSDLHIAEAQKNFESGHDCLPVREMAVVYGGAWQNSLFFVCNLPCIFIR